MTSTNPDLVTIENPWNDPGLSTAERVGSLIASMTLREKVAQLYGTWLAATPDGRVAPHQSEMDEVGDITELLTHGLGQLTRSFGTVPVDAGVGAAILAGIQRTIADSNRFGIPALAHEECLAGFTTWGATAYPVPLSWGATFNPELVRTMAKQIGFGMRSVGVHQGLAPVLDVTRDPRWGRTEETIGEDPYLVGTIATAYIKGLESAGIVATLKHFVGYSASRAGRNLAPVSMGSRELADIMLAPFEMAIRESGVRSVMHSYADIDGIPAAANKALLTTLLRDTWGFEGTVVADYFGIGFLKLLHGVAATWGDAAALALRAGVDVELPTLKTYSGPLVAEVTAGRLPESYVDRALARVLSQKVELGLLDPDWSPLPTGFTDEDAQNPENARGRIDLDTEQDRDVARAIAEQAVVLLSNDGTLPLAGGVSTNTERIAIIGPCANDAMTMLGCYSFPSHVGVHHPEIPIGIELPTVADALAREFPEAALTITLGCEVSGDDRSGIADAATAAAESDVAIVVLGDRAGLFGRGTSGEGCDAESLELPGVQSELLEAVLASGSSAGTRIIVVLVSGRPYALGSAPQRAGAIVQSFFPGEEGGGAIAGVISGRVNPSGRLPVSVPRHAGAQPSTYLAPRLAMASEVSNIDPTPAFGFGHGLSYTHFDWSEFSVNGSPDFSTVPAGLPTDGSVSLTVTVRNAGGVRGVDVVQLYLHDPVASVVRPVARLIGYQRIDLDVGEAARVVFEVPADVSSFTGVDGLRIVESGELELRLARSSTDTVLSTTVNAVGPVRHVDHTRQLHCRVLVKTAEY
jgi:beta-xylosidase